MSSRMPLEAFSVFGNSMQNTLIIAGHPEERFLPDGDFAPTARSILLRLKDQEAVYFDEFDFALNQSWMSNNGTVYCTGIHSDKLFSWRNGAWKDEKFSSVEIEAVNGIFGISGDDPSEDQLYLTTNDSIFFARIDGEWSRHVPPVEVNLLCNPYGKVSNEIYVGGSGLFLWNGSQFEQLEEPENDSFPAFCFTPDGRLIGGDNRLHISNEGGGWDTIETDYSDFMSIAEYDGALYAATYDGGIVRIFPGEPEAVTDPLETDSIISVHDGIIAFGETGVFASYDGEKWFPIELPECERDTKFR